VLLVSVSPAEGRGDAVSKVSPLHCMRRQQQQQQRQRQHGFLIYDSAVQPNWEILSQRQLVGGKCHLQINLKVNLEEY
jgi:hypothetical protein